MAANIDEASLARLSLTSCCAANFLRGHRPVRNPSTAWGLGTLRLAYETKKLIKVLRQGFWFAAKEVLLDILGWGLDSRH